MPHIVTPETLPAILLGLEYTNYNGIPAVSGRGLFTGKNLIIPRYSPEGEVVKLLGPDAFRSDVVLESIVLPEGLTAIDVAALFGCAQLKYIVIPSTVTLIDVPGFLDCNSLTDIYIDQPEGTLSGAPWNADNATIHWNSKGPQ